MQGKTRSRTLAVILHADVAGSTMLVQRDETIAHDRITDAFRRLSSTIREYGGMVLEIRGDALIGEFDRTSDAVSAALRFQQDNAQQNAQFDDEIIPIIRMGISLGEVLIADNTVTGPGVVMAQRLEQLSEPGGVCIQSAVYEALLRRLPFDCHSLGEQHLKGFDETTKPYSVNLKTGAAIPMPEAKSAPPSHRRELIAAGLAVALVIGGLLTWLVLRKPVVESVTKQNVTVSESVAEAIPLGLTGSTASEVPGDTKEAQTNTRTTQPQIVGSANPVATPPESDTANKPLETQVGLQTGAATGQLVVGAAANSNASKSESETASEVFKARSDEQISPATDQLSVDEPRGAGIVASVEADSSKQEMSHGEQPENAFSPLRNYRSTRGVTLDRTEPAQVTVVVKKVFEPWPTVYQEQTPRRYQVVRIEPNQDGLLRLPRSDAALGPEYFSTSEIAYIRALPGEPALTENDLAVIQRHVEISSGSDIRIELVDSAKLAESSKKMNCNGEGTNDQVNLICDIQKQFVRLGKKTSVDGLAGKGTRGLIREFQHHKQLPVTGSPSQNLLAQLRKESRWPSPAERESDIAASPSANSDKRSMTDFKKDVKKAGKCFGSLFNKEKRKLNCN